MIQATDTTHELFDCGQTQRRGSGKVFSYGQCRSQQLISVGQFMHKTDV